jgi:methylenetetrahydrofolate dehydrogenase (NADP+)/methenyltetrahydrofolate cyclohydrolase
MAVIMRSSELVEELKRRLKTETKLLRERGILPTLAVVQVGDDFSDAFVRGKRRDCAEVGIEFILHKLEPSVGELELVKLLQELGAKEEVHGIILQLPLPRHLNKKRILSNIVPIKDVDGLHPINVGRLWTGAYDLERDLLPCTPKGVIWLLEHFGIEISGKLAVIINRSDLVGKPLAKLLLDRDATVVICHSKTKRLAEIARQADLLVSAVGRRPEFTVTESMVAEGAVVVDVGLSRVEGKLVGDVDLERVSRKASHVTPVPGGVGPVTRVALLHNLLIAAKRQESKQPKGYY